ncbi:serine hydrolase domain-containing protein [Pricia sp. S334]|uniref:Serine hydrolase domain-containing protein n=1 Tax=Pricia mediterranea TaxID=3076079 RepID=A0ABU3L373_9FLAO|nr:serine hydrolase domain-containing protein [Pricia sp. S334]MDT7828190.1 serine hydrolase domain-containing protein [Pricia sp. S334]
MRSFKIIVGALIAIPLFFVVATLCGNSSAEEAETKALAKVPELVKASVDPKEVALYSENKRELQVALAAYFKKAVALGDIVGAGVSIVKGDSIVVSEGFGKRKSGERDKVDGETVFRLGSLSKGFAGVLAAELEDEGKLHWSDKVRDFVPDFQLGDIKNTAKITLAHILSHTSGTPYHSYTNLVDAGIPIGKIASMFKKVNPISEPGAMYSYQNAMFSLSSEIMREASGEDFAEALQNRFFNPLEMCSTTTDFDILSQNANVAIPHVRATRGWRSTKLTDSYHNAIAAGGINASAGDMAKWMRFLLGHNPEIMNEAALADAFDPQIEIKSGRKYYYRWPGHLTSYYAYGWRIHKFQEDDAKAPRTIWHHGGSVNHFRNEIAIYPESDLGICVLLNSNSRLASTVIPDLYAIVKGIYTKNSPVAPSTASALSDNSDYVFVE